MQELITYYSFVPIKSKQRGEEKILLSLPIPVDPSLEDMVDGEAAQQQQQQQQQQSDARKCVWGRDG